jgi:hypothetical protein
MTSFCSALKSSEVRFFWLAAPKLKQKVDPTFEILVPLFFFSLSALLPLSEPSLSSSFLLLSFFQVLSRHARAMCQLRCGDHSPADRREGRPRVPPQFPQAFAVSDFPQVHSLICHSVVSSYVSGCLHEDLTFRASSLIVSRHPRGIYGSAASPPSAASLPGTYPVSALLEKSAWMVLVLAKCCRPC